MKRKRLLILAAALAGVLVMGRVGLGFVYSATWLEDLLEENLSCDVEVGRVSLSLLAGEVVAREVKLSPPDGDRWTGISASEVELGVKLLPLLGRKLEVKSLMLRRPEVAMRINEDGDVSLAGLFSSPGDQGDESGRPSEGGLDAAENRWLARLEETRIEDGSVRILLEKDDLIVNVDDLGVRIEELRFDPENLETLNEVKMNLAAKARLHEETGARLVFLDLEGPVWGRLFDPATGDFDADVEADLRLGDGSSVDPRIKVVRRVWDLASGLEKIGLRPGELPSDIGFGRGQRLAGSYREGRVSLRAPLGLAIGSWEVGLGKDSWITTHDGEHRIIAEFLVGGKVGGAVGAVIGELPKELREVAGERFLEDDHFLVKVVSEGNLSDPEVDYLSQLPESKPVIDKLEEKAKGLLRGLFDDKE